MASRRRSRTDLSSLAVEINPQVSGWIGYYGAFYRSELYFLALPHRSASRSMGQAQVQTTQVQPGPCTGPGSPPSNGESPDCSCTGRARRNRRVGL